MLGVGEDQGGLVAEQHARGDLLRGGVGVGVGVGVRVVVGVEVRVGVRVGVSMPEATCVR